MAASVKHTCAAFGRTLAVQTHNKLATTAVDDAHNVKLTQVQSISTAYFVTQMYSIEGRMFDDNALQRTCTPHMVELE